jgi:hypothetical protein
MYEDQSTQEKIVDKLKLVSGHVTLIDLVWSGDPIWSHLGMICDIYFRH